MNFTLLICAIVFALFGVLLEMITHDKPFRLLQYFTLQSNIIAGLSGIAYLLWPTLTSLQILQSAILWMLVTGIIFHAMISKFYKPTGYKWISNHLTHTLSPIFFFIVLFTLNSPMTTTAMWISYPLLYTAFWLGYGHVKDYYPYWFLRPNAPYPDGLGSYTKVFGFIAAMSVCFMLLGLILSQLLNLV